MKPQHSTTPAAESVGTDSRLDDGLMQTCQGESDHHLCCVFSLKHLTHIHHNNLYMRNFVQDMLYSQKILHLQIMECDHDAHQYPPPQGMENWK